LLSYRHSFHAGNFADVLKHIVQVEILNYLAIKDKPFEYIDTHSGAGLFNFDSSDAQKLQEHLGGIAKLDHSEFPELQSYFEVANSYDKQGLKNIYPGSPSIAKQLLRKQDRGWLFELHPQDFQHLTTNMERDKRIRVAQKDGLQGLLSLLPPTSRRALVLIDPSYEIKTEYSQVFETVAAAHKKFATGTYAIWYPVVNRSVIDKMHNQFAQSGIKNIQCFELGIKEDSAERGMTSSGMIVVNPPWTLFDKMKALLPKLAKTLGESDKLIYRCEVIAGE